MWAIQAKCFRVSYNNEWNGIFKRIIEIPSALMVGGTDQSYLIRDMENRDKLISMSYYFRRSSFYVDWSCLLYCISRNKLKRKYVYELRSVRVIVIENFLIMEGLFKRIIVCVLLTTKKKNTPKTPPIMSIPNIYI
jgi:hypothetical protein